jgi:hypothetical protein
MTDEESKVFALFAKRRFEEREKLLLDGIAAYLGSDKLKCDLLERYAGQIRAFKKTNTKTERSLSVKSCFDNE